jgi:cytochrome c-type biogenesis protein
METILETLKEVLANNFFAAFILAYFGGVLTTFTPCVYPMMPVTIAITLGTDKEEKSSWQKLSRPFFYCLGIVSAYTLLGIFVSATGAFFGQWADAPLLYIIMSAVFIFLGLSMLGIINLPTVQLGYKMNKAGAVSLFFFGMLTGVVFSPCTTPILALFLVYASTKSLLGGGLLLFAFASGFSSILLLMAAASIYAKDKIPKSGKWLNLVKIFIAIVCFVVAAYLLGKVFSLTSLL